MTPLPMTALDRLLVDAPAELTPVSAPQAVQAHQRHRASWCAPVVDSLLLPDLVLAAAARATGEDPGLTVTASVSGGAGGLVPLARRSSPGLRVTAAVTTLRNLDDLGGNAARVVAAASQLDEIEVYVGLPPAAGWLRAVEVVEAGGLLAAVTAGPGGALGLAQQLSVLVEADLPFLVLPHPDEHHLTGHDPALLVLALLRATWALVEGASPAETAGLLPDGQGADAVDAVETVSRWDEATAARVRRRLRRVVLPVGVTAAGLTDLGLLAAPPDA